MNQIKNAYAAQWSNPKNTNQKPNHEERIWTSNTRHTGFDTVYSTKLLNWSNKTVACEQKNCAAPGCSSTR